MRAGKEKEKKKVNASAKPGKWTKSQKNKKDRRSN
jgi:hypothetical protein